MKGLKVCYGPVYYTPSGDRRPAGSSLALCDMSPQKGGRALSTHQPSVDCPECISKLSAAPAA